MTAVFLYECKFVSFFFASSVGSVGSTEKPILTNHKKEIDCDTSSGNLGKIAKSVEILTFVLFDSKEHGDCFVVHGSVCQLTQKLWDDWQWSGNGGVAISIIFSPLSCKKNTEPDGFATSKHHPKKQQSQRKARAPTNTRQFSSVRRISIFICTRRSAHSRRKGKA